MVETETGALKYEGARRATVRRQHEAAILRRVPLPSAEGAFPATRLPWVFPLVMDCQALGRDLGRRARSGRTVLVSGACSGVLRLFAARHVADEVAEYMAEWAGLGRCSVEQVEALWVREYLPLLRVVDVPLGPLYADERARVDVLDTIGHPYGDPDDVPTAVLALLLDAPVLSTDANLLRAVYGYDFDCVAHAEWLAALRAGGDLGPLGQFLNSAYLLTGGLAMGTLGLVAHAVEVFGWPLTLLAVGAGALGIHLLASQETKAKVLRTMKTGAVEGWELLQALAVTSGQALAEIESLAPGSRPIRSGPYDGCALLHRACLHTVARARSGHVSASELSEILGHLSVPHGEKKVRHVLRAERAFELVGRGRFQLGRALVRPAALDVGTKSAS